MRSIRNLVAASAIAVTGIVSASQAYAADIVDTAVAAGSFKTLVAAVQAAGLVVQFAPVQQWLRDRSLAAA